VVFIIDEAEVDPSVFCFYPYRLPLRSNEYDLAFARVAGQIADLSPAKIGKSSIEADQIWVLFFAWI
jgi:hypothetical protein